MVLLLLQTQRRFLKLVIVSMLILMKMKEMEGIIKYISSLCSFSPPFSFPSQTHSFLSYHSNILSTILIVSKINKSRSSGGYKKSKTNDLANTKTKKDKKKGR